MVQYKTFGMVFVKKCLQPAKFLFDSPQKIEISKLFYHWLVGCRSRGIEDTGSKITFFSYLALAAFGEKSQKLLKNHNFENSGF